MPLLFVLANNEALGKSVLFYDSVNKRNGELLYGMALAAHRLQERHTTVLVHGWVRQTMLLNRTGLTFM